MLISLFAISQLGKYCVLSDEITSSNEYEDNDQSSDDSINVIDTFGEELLDSTKSKSKSGQLTMQTAL